MSGNNVSWTTPEDLIIRRVGSLNNTGYITSEEGFQPATGYAPTDDSVRNTFVMVADFDREVNVFIPAGTQLTYSPYAALAACYLIVETSLG